MKSESVYNQFAELLDIYGLGLLDAFIMNC
jgi:hypothetical protein